MAREYSFSVLATVGEAMAGVDGDAAYVALGFSLTEIAAIPSWSDLRDHHRSTCRRSADRAARIMRALIVCGGAPIGGQSVLRGCSDRRPSADYLASACG